MTASVDLGQLQVTGLVQDPLHRRSRWDRANHRRQVQQALEIADRLTAQDQHQCQVHQDLALVIDRGESPPPHRGRQARQQIALPGQQPYRQHSGMPNQPVIIASEPQPAGP